MCAQQAAAGWAAAQLSKQPHVGNSRIQCCHAAGTHGTGPCHSVQNDWCASTIRGKPSACCVRNTTRAPAASRCGQQAVKQRRPCHQLVPLLQGHVEPLGARQLLAVLKGGAVGLRRRLWQARGRRAWMLRWRPVLSGRWKAPLNCAVQAASMRAPGTRNRQRARPGGARAPCRKTRARPRTASP